MQLTINNRTFTLKEIGEGKILKSLPSEVSHTLGERELLALEQRISEGIQKKDEVVGTFDVINHIDDMQAYAHFRFTK